MNDDRYTLLSMKAQGPITDTRFPDRTVHAIFVSFAKASSVKVQAETLEVNTSDILGTYIHFYAGQDMKSFIKGMRDYADYLERKIS